MSNGGQMSTVQYLLFLSPFVVTILMRIPDRVDR